MHLLGVAQYIVEEAKLVLRPHEVVLLVLDFIVHIAVQVVGQEAHALHIRE